MTVTNQAEDILARIEAETDPLRMCLHYREAADILPELLAEIRDLRLQVDSLVDQYGYETTRLEQIIEELSDANYG